jgi:4-hydroxy-tetrahydrodipicolinate synthase
MPAQPFGLSVALTTAFSADGSIDLSRTVRHALSCLDRQCVSVTLFGTTGEGASLSRRERTALLGAALGAGVPAGRIVGGVMASAVDDAVDQMLELYAAGGKAVLLAPPFYYKSVSDDALFAWFSTLFNRLGKAGRDVILYNIPSVTAVELSVDLIGRLRAAFPAVIGGVKDSSGDWPYTEKLLAAHRDIPIMIGDERSLAAGVRLGAQGAISGISNVYPERIAKMIASGKDDEGLNALLNTVLRFPVTPAVKTLVAFQYKHPEWNRARSPLAATPAAGIAEIEAAMQRLPAA